MSHWYKHLSLQQKLGLMFCIITLVAAASIAADMYAITTIRSQNFRVLGIFDKAQSSYQAQADLQNIELAGQSYVLTSDEKWLDAHTSYAARLEAYLRQTTFDASTDEERKILLDLQQAWAAYSDHFQQIVEAISADDEEQLDIMLELADQDLFNMYNHVDRIGAQSTEAFERAREQITFFTMLIVGFTLLALLLFAGTAILATAVLNSQLGQPVQLVRHAASELKTGRFDPAVLQELEQRPDEIGRMAHEFIQMAASVEQQMADLQKQAQEIREKIH